MLLRYHRMFDFIEFIEFFWLKGVPLKAAARRPNRPTTKVSNEAMALLRLSMLLLPSAAVALSSRMMKDSCLDHQCSKGWVSKIDADTKEGNTDDECCDRTCALYTCPEEFALNGENKDVIADRDTCCLPLCKHYKCEDGYEADPGQQDKTYNPDKNEARDRCCYNKLLKGVSDTLHKSASDKLQKGMSRSLNGDHVKQTTGKSTAS